MKVTIDLEDLKEYIGSLSPYKDEWYGSENYMTGDCICDFLEWNNKKKFVEEFRLYLDKELVTA
jgi:hypothetical protein